MSSGLRVACFVMGVIVLFGMKFETDFKNINDFFAAIIAIGFPLILMIVPVVLEYLERSHQS